MLICCSECTLQKLKNIHRSDVNKHKYNKRLMKVVLASGINGILHLILSEVLLYSEPYNVK